MRISEFLRLEWLQFTRSAYFQKGLAIKILMGFLILYFGGIAILLGVGAYFIAEEVAPDVDPFVTVNNILKKSAVNSGLQIGLEKGRSRVWKSYPRQRFSLIF